MTDEEWVLIPFIRSFIPTAPGGKHRLKKLSRDVSADLGGLAAQPAGFQAEKAAIQPAEPDPGRSPPTRPFFAQKAKSAGSA